MRAANQSSLALVVVMLFAAICRVAALGQDLRFHPDEALYATYARGMAVHGDWLLRQIVVPLDKPPLGIAITALGFSLWGVNEFAGRLIGVLISLLVVSLAMALTQRAAGRRAALICGALLACTPYEIAFAPTLFHDPILTGWLLASAWALSWQRYGVAGLMAAAALATKQSAIQFLPLFIVVGLAAGAQAKAASNARPSWQNAVVRAALGLAVGLGGLWLWGAVRGVQIDFYTLGITNPGTLRWIRSAEVGPRLETWSRYLAYGVNPLALIVATVLLLRQRGLSSRAQVVAWLCALGVGATLVLYWVIAYNTYDRYLIPLMALLAIGASCALVRVRWWVIAALCLGTAPLTLQAVNATSPLVRPHALNAEIVMLAAALRTLPPSAIIHQFRLDWDLGFYLGDPLAERLPTMKFAASPEALATQLCAEPDVTIDTAIDTAINPRMEVLVVRRPLLARWQQQLTKNGVEITPFAVGLNNDELSAEFGLLQLRCAHPAN